MSDTAHLSPDGILVSFLAGLRAGTPLQCEGLTLFPLLPTDPVAALPVSTLDEALAAGDLLVTETDREATVGTVVVENASARPVFIMAGEILRGAKQDRTLRVDIIVPARSGKLPIDCFCTERGRWHHVSERFEVSGHSLPSSIRAKAKASRSQSAVWESIAEYQERVACHSPTESAREVLAAPAIRRNLEAYEADLGALPQREPGAVGVLAMFGERLLAVDVFGDPEVLAKLYPKLLRAYAADMLETERPARPPTRRKAQAVLRRARSATWRDREPQGSGAALEADPADFGGTALVLAGQVVHSDYFPSPE